MGRPTYLFDSDAMNTLVGGVSALDMAALNLKNRDEAAEFVLTYGYDVKKEEDVQKLWGYHRKAVTYLQTELLRPDETIPDDLTDPGKLEDILNLLLIASVKGNERQRWACGILKVMHIYVHLENDLFSQFQSEIQEQILRPIESHVQEDPILGVTLGPPLGKNSIILKKFEVKNFKTSISSVTKLLAKKELVAFNLLDRIGVRIVTKHLVDAFRVLKYFLDEHIVSFPNNIPDQSNNTLYPLNLFLEHVETLDRKGEYTGEEFDRKLYERLKEQESRAQYLEKRNVFTSEEYRFIKFITRRLVRVQIAGESPKTISFFYPFEVQIVDYETHLKNMTGSASHDQYKERQIRKARARVLGFAGPKEKNGV